MSEHRPRQTIVALLATSSVTVACTCTPTQKEHAVASTAPSSGLPTIAEPAAQQGLAANAKPVVVAPPENSVREAETDPPRAADAPLSTRPFPEDLPLFQPMERPMAGDRPLRVTHAAKETVRPIVYLHGMCGNSKGADPWSDVAARYGTLIVVRANERCEDRPGYKWPKDLEAIQERIDAALSEVKESRGGWLDIEHPAIIGYSQGSYRAEQLVMAYPRRYDRAILGGHPTPPSYEALKSLQAVAVLGGELEDHSHMLKGALDLRDHGKRARFFLLPQVHHGSYGPQGRQVMTDVLEFVFAPHSTQ